MKSAMMKIALRHAGWCRRLRIWLTVRVFESGMMSIVCDVMIKSIGLRSELSFTIRRESNLLDVSRPQKRNSEQVRLLFNQRVWRP